MAKHLTDRIALYLLLSLTLVLIGATTVRAADADTDRGRYLVTIMDCTGCHTGGALAGRPDATRYLAGSEVGFGGPEGIVFPPNLTPDMDTGTGAWTEDQLIQAFTQGRRPDGRMLAPIMPWPSYASLSAEDARAIARYLRSLTPVRFQAPAPVAAGGQSTSPYLTLTAPKS